jgi:hypothetical protein
MDDHVCRRNAKSVPNRPDLSIEKRPHNQFMTTSLASRREGSLNTRFEGEGPDIRQQTVDYDTVLETG